MANCAKVKFVSPTTFHRVPNMQTVQNRDIILVDSTNCQFQWNRNCVKPPISLKLQQKKRTCRCINWKIQHQIAFTQRKTHATKIDFTLWSQTHPFLYFEPYWTLRWSSFFYALAKSNSPFVLGENGTHSLIRLQVFSAIESSDKRETKNIILKSSIFSFWLLAPLPTLDCLFQCKASKRMGVWKNFQTQIITVKKSSFPRFQIARTMIVSTSRFFFCNYIFSVFSGCSQHLQTCQSRNMLII